MTQVAIVAQYPRLGFVGIRLDADVYTVFATKTAAKQSDDQNWRRTFPATEQAKAWAQARRWAKGLDEAAAKAVAETANEVTALLDQFPNIKAARLAATGSETMYEVELPCEGHEWSADENQWEPCYTHGEGCPRDDR